MTFENTAWAIDGSLLGSSLARRAEYAAVSGAAGIVQKGDLKVTQLGTPGVGVQIAAGVGLVLNDYQTAPNETYVVSNPSVHTIAPGDMPASNPAAKSYILAIVIGDPDFSQTGHPWMLSTDPPVGTEQTFQYVRPTLIEVAAGVTTLNVDYPALVIARLDIPANTTTIIDSYIVDLRKLARPRQEQQIFVSGSAWSNASPALIAAGSTYTDWGAAQFSPTVVVPSWAKRAILVASVNGVGLIDTTLNTVGAVRAHLGSVVGPITAFDTPVGTGAIRMNLQAAGSFDVSTVAGTSVALKIQGYESVPAVPTGNQTLRLISGSQQIFDVRFFEE